MDINDRDNLKEFVSELYGAQSRSWSMNEKVFDIVYKMLNESSACTDLMDLVPRPHALGKAPIKYLTKEIRSSVVRKLKQRKEYYSSCLKVIALNYKTHIQLAAMGL